MVKAVIIVLAVAVQRRSETEMIFVMNRKYTLVVAALLSIGLGCSKSKPAAAERRFFVAFSQCNNAEPYRAAPNALMTKLFEEAPDVKLVIARRLAGQQQTNRPNRGIHSAEAGSADRRAE